MGTYHYFSRLRSFLDNNNLAQPIYDINTALEWHNVIKLLNLKIKPDNPTDDSCAYLQEKAKQFPRNIGIFLQTINDGNFLQILLAWSHEKRTVETSTVLYIYRLFPLDYRCYIL